MANLTLALDDELLQDARRVAFERETSLTELIRSYLKDLVAELDLDQEAKARELMETIQRNSRHFGKITWTRDELHERD